MEKQRNRFCDTKHKNALTDEDLGKIDKYLKSENLKIIK
jgi:hypothetical protein